MSEDKKCSKFWIKDPFILLNDLVLFPVADMCRSEKFNALTRLVLIIAVIMYFMKYKHWFNFLIISILVVVVLKYAGEKNCPCKQKEELEKKKKVVEHFSVVPTYTGTDFQQTIVAPTFAEEWQIPPPAYDIYTQVPYSGPGKNTFNSPMKPQTYPYGQYLTRTNLLPSDEYYTHLGCGGAKTAREYINSTYLRHDLARRENMTRIYKKKLNRRFRSSSVGGDTFSPFHSY